MNASKSDISLELRLLLIFATLWGASYASVKIGGATIPPLTLIATSISIAGLILLSVVRLRGLTLPPGVVHWRQFLLQACLTCVIPFTLVA